MMKKGSLAARLMLCLMMLVSFAACGEDPDAGADLYNPGTTETKSTEGDSDKENMLRRKTILSATRSPQWNPSRKRLHL